MTGGPGLRDSRGGSRAAAALAAALLAFCLPLAGALPDLSWWSTGPVPLTGATSCFSFFPVKWIPVYLVATNSTTLHGIAHARDCFNRREPSPPSCLATVRGTIVTSWDAGLTWTCRGVSAAAARLRASHFAYSSPTGAFSLICLAGGHPMNADEDTSPTRSVVCSQNLGLDWKDAPALPFPIAGAVATVTDSAVYIMGGFRDTGDNGTLLMAPISCPDTPNAFPGASPSPGTSNGEEDDYGCWLGEWQTLQPSTPVVNRLRPVAQVVNFNSTLTTPAGMNPATTVPAGRYLVASAGYECPKDVLITTGCTPKYDMYALALNPATSLPLTGTWIKVAGSLPSISSYPGVSALLKFPTWGSFPLSSQALAAPNGGSALPSSAVAHLAIISGRGFYVMDASLRWSNVLSVDGLTDNPSSTTPTSNPALALPDGRGSFYIISANEDPGARGFHRGFVRPCQTSPAACNASQYWGGCTVSPYDTTCRTCTICSALGSPSSRFYEASPCRALSSSADGAVAGVNGVVEQDAVCRPCSSCRQGWRLVAACTATSDTVCEMLPLWDPVLGAVVLPAGQSALLPPLSGWTYLGLVVAWLAVWAARVAFVGLPPHAATEMAPLAARKATPSSRGAAWLAALVASRPVAAAAALLRREAHSVLSGLAGIACLVWGAAVLATMRVTYARAGLAVALLVCYCSCLLGSYIATVRLLLRPAVMTELWPVIAGGAGSSSSSSNEGEAVAEDGTDAARRVRRCPWVPRSPRWAALWLAGVTSRYQLLRLAGKLSAPAVPSFARSLVWLCFSELLLQDVAGLCFVSAAVALVSEGADGSVVLSNAGAFYNRFYTTADPLSVAAIVLCALRGVAAAVHITALRRRFDIREGKVAVRRGFTSPMAGAAGGSTTASSMEEGGGAGSAAVAPAGGEAPAATAACEAAPSPAPVVVTPAPVAALAGTPASVPASPGVASLLGSGMVTPGLPPSVFAAETESAGRSQPPHSVNVGTGSNVDAGNFSFDSGLTGHLTGVGGTGVGGGNISVISAASGDPLPLTPLPIFTAVNVSSLLSSSQSAFRPPAPRGGGGGVASSNPLLPAAAGAPPAATAAADAGPQPASPTNDGSAFDVSMYQLEHLLARLEPYVDVTDGSIHFMPRQRGGGGGGGPGDAVATVGADAPSGAAGGSADGFSEEELAAAHAQATLIVDQMIRSGLLVPGGNLPPLQAPPPPYAGAPQAAPGSFSMPMPPPQMMGMRPLVPMPPQAAPAPGVAPPLGVGLPAGAAPPGAGGPPPPLPPFLGMHRPVPPPPYAVVPPAPLEAYGAPYGGGYPLMAPPMGVPPHYPHPHHPHAAAELSHHLQQQQQQGQAHGHLHRGERLGSQVHAGVEGDEEVLLLDVEQVPHHLHHHQQHPHHHPHHPHMGHHHSVMHG